MTESLGYSIRLVDLFAASMDAGNQVDAALCVLAHPGSASMTKESLSTLTDIAFDGVVVESRVLDTLWRVADCWEMLDDAASC